jgi:hypothetical protein
MSKHILNQEEALEEADAVRSLLAVMVQVRQSNTALSLSVTS